MENIALIVGAGAVENSWKPIIRALQPLNNNLELDRDSANSMLSGIIHTMRYFSHKEKIHSANIDKEASIYNSIRKLICNEIEKSIITQELKVRPELENILRKYVIELKGKILVVNTNWDDTIEKYINNYKPSNDFEFESQIIGMHIHGKYTDYKTLYLPSEISHEKYRSAEEVNHFSQINAETLVLLEKCNIAIIYGLSLDPMDAELTQIISMGLDNDNLKEVIIIDPCPDIVSNRIKAQFIGKKSPILKCLKPNTI